MNNNFGLEEWMNLIDWHVQMRPAMTARDVYKLIFQGIRGAEHIMPSPEIFTAVLRQELDSLQPSYDEPICELIRPNNELSRINLRAYFSRSQDINWLVDVCLRTGRRRWGSQQDLFEIWQAFQFSVRWGYFPTITEEDVNSLDAWIKKYDFPAAHHSSIYEVNYRPAYRLVANELLRGKYS
jgi:hypothetical protein